MHSMSVINAPAVESRPRSARAPTQRPRLDRAGILDGLAALRERCSGDADAFRESAIAILRAALDGGREEARRALESGGTGRACAETLSAQIDDLVYIALETTTRWNAPGQARPTVVAVGGYGRGMLAPGSDIDLLFLLSLIHI